MALTIEIDHVNIREYTVDIDNAQVRVRYLKEEADGSFVATGYAVFWATMPQNPTAEDFSLPPAYVQELLDIRAAAKTAIETRLGIV